MRMMPDTEALFDLEGFKYSCTVVIGETVLFFGGMYQKRQISQLSPLGLLRIGTLPFPLIGGACIVGNSRIFLGFPEDDYYSCWSRLAVLNSESC